MKNKITILLLSVFPAISTLYGQVVFYNKGQMSVVGQDTSKTVLYIQGNMVVATDDADPSVTSNISMTKSKVVLTGDFINNVQQGQVFANHTSGSEGLFEFKPLVADTQRIRTTKTTFDSIPNKGTNFINFPHLKLVNDHHLIVHPEMSVVTQDIILQKGWMILDSRRVNSQDFNLATSEQLANRSLMAHLLPKGSIKYTGWERTGNVFDRPANERGFIEVRIRLDDYAASNMGDRKEMMGFGIPFKRMYSDYFTYNHLFAPIEESFFGKNKTPIGAVDSLLHPGVGYATSIDVRGSIAGNYWDIQPGLIGEINFEHRAKDGHYFNRFRFAEDPNRMDNMENPHYEAYEVEQLNNDDVEVPLHLGYNYLANPFMAPLDVTDLLNSGSNSTENTTVTTKWGVLPANSSFTNRDIYNRIWILKGDAGSQSAGDFRKMYVYYNYYVAKAAGGTYDGDTDYDGYNSADGSVLIHPLQMFVIRATDIGAGKNIRIPKANRTNSAITFTRSGEKNKRKDDFIVEVIDNKTGYSDRANVVLRPTLDLIYKQADYFSIKKARVKADTDEKTDTPSALIEDGIVEQSIFSQLYTQDNSGLALSVKFLATELTEQEPLYLMPAAEPQEITIRGIRMQSKTEVGYVYLEDKLKKTTIELTPDTRYVTDSYPDDAVDRFILHFKQGSGIDDEVSKERSIYAHYDNGLLTVAGFSTDDFGGIINLVSMQGTLVVKAEITDTTVKIPCYLPTGAYIVKTTGTKPYVTKLLAK